jgi:hypothetical protein
MITLDAKTHNSTSPTAFSRFIKDIKLYAKEICWSRKFRKIAATIQNPMARNDKKTRIYPWGVDGFALIC